MWGGEVARVLKSMWGGCLFTIAAISLMGEVAASVNENLFSYNSEASLYSRYMYMYI